ncbi:Hypothetical predicted protein [Olea europaea subsp. europaea]|uniref:Uncharacterized protein n=1 Tax=Olea europaea subsp. europaea TaxID=158383 RepID=A0A8S0SP54_OLEEU|nr:Hypothetical predicted protein [Olea europaea subsp. europaea]
MKSSSICRAAEGGALSKEGLWRCEIGPERCWAREAGVVAVVTMVVGTGGGGGRSMMYWC